MRTKNIFVSSVAHCHDRNCALYKNLVDDIEVYMLYGCSRHLDDMLD